MVFTVWYLAVRGLHSTIHSIGAAHESWRALAPIIIADIINTLYYFNLYLLVINIISTTYTGRRVARARHVLQQAPVQSSQTQPPSPSLVKIRVVNLTLDHLLLLLITIYI